MLTKVFLVGLTLKISSALLGGLGLWVEFRIVGLVWLFPCSLVVGLGVETLHQNLKKGFLSFEV